MMKHATYTDKFWGPGSNSTSDHSGAAHYLQGIYLNHLNIKSEQVHKYQVHYMDMSIMLVKVSADGGRDGGGTYKYKTTYLKA